MSHQDYMQRCLQLAAGGKGTVSPNPLVGAVIVHSGKIIGEGFHCQAGQPHAEVNAIDSVADLSQLKQSTIYVSLEPCSHYGKTPPCANLIIQHKIPKVVISCQDPNPKVAGKGIEILRNNGVEVIENILQQEGEWLNRRFFTVQRKKRPYIILKWAQSQDGYIDAQRNKNEKGIHWITHPYTQMLTHQWRSREDAILIGSNTALVDNPSLTTRSYSGKSPIRVLIDSELKISKNSRILDQSVPTFVFNKQINMKDEKIQYCKISDNTNYIDFILKTLFNNGIQSLIVEGGAQTLSTFITSNQWDEARILTGNCKLRAGITVPKIKVAPKYTSRYGNDLIETIVNPKR